MPQGRLHKKTIAGGRWFLLSLLAAMVAPRQQSRLRHSVDGSSSDVVAGACAVAVGQFVGKIAALTRA